MNIRNAEDVFISRGFSNWKLTTSVNFDNCHKEAVEKIITLQAKAADVGER